MKNITPAVTHVLSELIETEAGVVGRQLYSLKAESNLKIMIMLVK